MFAIFRQTYAKKCVRLLFFAKRMQNVNRGTIYEDGSTIRLTRVGMPWLSGGCGSFSRHEPPPPGHGSVPLEERYVVAHSNAALRYLADTLPMRMDANACGETPALRLCYFGMSVGVCGFSFQCFFQTSGVP